MESRSVYLGVAVRLRGCGRGTLSRDYLHSHVTEALYYDVAEIETLLPSRLAHANMLASIYGNPATNPEDGHEQVKKLYLSSLRMVPYMKAVTADRRPSEVAALVDEWRRLNSSSADTEHRP